MTGNCEIINSTFDNNNGQFGGGLGVRGNASVINSTFTNNQGAFGAAVDMRDGICSFINNSFINNVVYRYGGAIDLSRVNYTFINSIFNYNRGDFRGGAIAIEDSSGSFINATFMGNKVTNPNSEGGGAVFIIDVMGVSVHTTFINSKFLNNSATINGGAVHLGGDCNFINSTFINNTAPEGGAVWMGNNGNFTNVTFTSNIAQEYGGAVRSYGTFNNFTNALFTENYAKYGGAVYIAGSGNFNNATFADNNVSISGGALYLYGGSGNFTNSIFNNNTASVSGGAVYFSRSNGNLTNSTFDDNRANSGAAVYTEEDSFYHFINDTFTANIAQEYGGAVYIKWDGMFTESKFNNNSAQYGGAVFINGSCTIINSTFTNNSASANGGALYLYNGSGNFTNSIFNNNTASVSGGAVYFSRSNGNLTNSTFDDNRANSGAAVYTEEDSFYHFINDTFTANIAQEYGGAVFINGSCTIVNSTFTNNSASADGGAVLMNNGSCTIVNSTFTNNSASANGGALSIKYGNCTIINSTFTNNSASADGGAVLMNNGSCTIVNSTFTNNSASANGGALSIKYGNCTIINSTFINNTAKYGGAIFLYFANYTFTDSTFKYNLVEMDGGAISILDASSGSFINATFMNNKINGLDYSDGGAVCIIDRTGSKYLNTFINSKFLNNSATRAGGAVYTDCICNFINSTFINNTAYTGGAVRMNSYYGNFINVTFIDNIAVYRGGAVFCNGGDPFNFTNALFIRNYAEDGGAIYNVGYGNFNNSTFTDNHVNGSGGALHLYSGGGNLTNNIFNNNTAVYGGAIFISRYNTNVYNSTFADNIANSAAAIYIVENTVTLDPLYVTFIDSTFIGNNATVGGTIFLNNSKQHSVFNVTKSQFKDNMGNIVYLTNADNITIDNDTKALSDFDLCCIYTNMTAIVMDYFYGSTGHILVNVSCLNMNLPYGIIQIIIGNKTYTGYLIEGQGVIDLDDVNVGYYAVSVLYNGSSLWAKSASNVNFTVFKKDVDMDLSITNITYGEDATVEVTFNETVEGFVYIKYDGKIYNVTVNGSKATIIVDQLDAGNYTFDVTFDSNNYNQTIQSVNLTVFKANSTISANVEDEDYMENIIINVTTPCEDGVIYVVINNQTYKGYVIGGEGSIIVTDLEPGFYTCNVTYNGSDNYNSCVESVNFTVNKLNVTVVATVEIDDNNNVLIHVLTDGDDGVAYVIINNRTYTGNIVNRTGVINITGLLPGVYETNLVYNGSVYYNPSVVPVNFTVDKYDSAISVNVVDVVYGKNVVVNVTTDCDDGEIYIELNGQKYTGYILGGKGSIIVPSLEPGSYLVNVTYNGSVHYNPCVVPVNFTVNRLNVTLVANVEIDDNDVLIHVLTDGDDGVAYVVINNRTYTGNIVNHTGVINITGLLPGVYETSLVYNGSVRYNPSVVPVNFTVDKYDSAISVNVVDVVYGKDVVVNVTTDCDDGEIYIELNGQKYTGYIVGGKGSIIVPSLEPGSYVVNVTYNGSVHYNSCVESVNFTVNKLNVTVVANVEIDDNDDVLIHVLTDGDDGVAYVVINNRTFTGNIVNRTGVINITGLLPGDYETNLVYNGSVHYNPSGVPVNFTVDKYDSEISVNVVDVVYGKDVIVNVTTDCDDSEIYIELNGQKYRGYILDGKGSIIVPSLEPGFYIGNVTYEGSDNYNPCVESVNFTVNRINSTTYTSVELKNGDVYINIFTTGEDSVAYVIFNGTNYTCDITDGQGMIIITGLDTGYYEANLTYAGTKYYNPSISYVNFVIGDKIDSSISVNTSDVVYGKDVLINVRTDCDDSIVYVIVNDQIFEGNIIGGIGLIRVSGLDVGNYELNVTYKGSDIYKPSVASVNFTVNPQPTCIRANGASYIINYGGSYKVNFDPLLEGANITFTINGKIISSAVTDKSGIAVIKLSPSQLSSIGAGSHNMIVSFAGNKNYLPFNTTVKVSINKENTLFYNVKSVKRYYKSNARSMQLTATLKNSKRKVMKNQWVYFKVNKKTFKVKTNSKGVAKLTLNRAKIKACKLNKKGIYKFTVTYKTTKTYKQTTKKGTLKVLK